jgi:hypothetical protein
METVITMIFKAKSFELCNCNEVPWVGIQATKLCIYIYIYCNIPKFLEYYSCVKFWVFKNFL